MSDPSAQEPTMEEILASIRRIISEDDAPAADASDAPVPPPPPVAAAPAAPAPEAHAAPHPAPSPVAHETEEEDVLELTEPAPTHITTHGDLEVTEREPETSPPPVAHEPPVEAVKPIPAGEDRLVSASSATVAASHFELLAQTIAMPAGGRTLEDLVRELLRPLLKEWLDQHLPAIVEAAVLSEVERISRRRT